MALGPSQPRTLNVKTARRREIQHHDEEHGGICAVARAVAGRMGAQATLSNPEDGRVFRGRPEEVR